MTQYSSVTEIGEALRKFERKLKQHDMDNVLKWHVVYTKPRWEKKVAELLSKSNIENYCPLSRVIKQWHDRKKIVAEPLFNCYVFVKCDSTKYNTVRSTSGVLNFLYWLGKPAIVKPEEIEAIRDFLASYQNVQLERAEVSPNDRVRIIEGPLINIEGNVLEVLNKKVKVFLPSLGYSLVAELYKSQVEIIRPKDSKSMVQ